MGIIVCVLLFTDLFCIIFLFRHNVFQQNLGRLKKGLARGERLEAFNIHTLLHMCILSELGKGNFNSLESLCSLYCRGRRPLGEAQVFH